MWDTVVATLRAEYADLGDTAQFTRAFARLALATALGACVGYEREMRGAIAGLRTHMLVALGVALFVVGTVESSISPQDLTRVLQGIIAGIGFVGAAAIIRPRDENQIRGVTTAAGIWATAAIAMAAGLGREIARDHRHRAGGGDADGAATRGKQARSGRCSRPPDSK